MDNYLLNLCSLAAKGEFSAVVTLILDGSVTVVGTLTSRESFINASKTVSGIPEAKSATYTGASAESTCLYVADAKVKVGSENRAINKDYVLRVSIERVVLYQIETSEVYKERTRVRSA